MSRRDYTLKGWKWKVADSWALVKGDGESANVAQAKREMQRSHPSASVMSSHRSVRAFNATIPIVAIVARVKEPCCTCGEEKGRRPAYLFPQVCAFCVAKPEAI